MKIMWHMDDSWNEYPKTLVTKSTDTIIMGGRVAKSVSRLATGWTVRGSNPGRGEIFRTSLYRPRDHLTSWTMGIVSFPGDKERPGRDADLLTPFSCRGQERVELYLFSPYGPYGLHRAAVPVQGCTLPFYHNHGEAYGGFQPLLY